MSTVTVTVVATADVEINEARFRGWLNELLRNVSRVSDLNFEVHRADGHHYRDNASGEFTTAADNAERPGQVSEENAP